MKLYGIGNIFDFADSAYYRKAAHLYLKLKGRKVTSHLHTTILRPQYRKYRR